MFKDGYRVIQLDDSDLSTFKKLVQGEVWVPDPEGNYKSIPLWARGDLLREGVGSLHEIYSDMFCPDEYYEFGKKVASKYVTELKDITKDNVRVTTWNGARPFDWHMDNDGTYDVVHGDEFVVLIYHVPNPLELEDGANISFGRVVGNDIELIETIVPTDGLGVVIPVNDKFRHKAVRLINQNKDRYTINIGIVDYVKKHLL